MHLRPVWTRGKNLAVELFGFGKASGLMMFQGLPQAGLTRSGIWDPHRLLRFLLLCLALCLPPSEEEGDIDAAVFVAGLEGDGVGFVEEVGIENHSAVGAVGDCHRPGILSLE